MTEFHPQICQNCMIGQLHVVTKNEKERLEILDCKFCETLFSWSKSILTLLRQGIWTRIDKKHPIMIKIKFKKGEEVE